MNILQDWNKWWSATEQERPEYDLSNTDNWRVAAAKSRSPEDKDWWYTNGYKFYENWIKWRKLNPHLSIALLNDGTQAIELEMAPVVKGVTIKMAIDRVFYDSSTEEYLIVDLKTGKNMPQSHLQLEMYAFGLRNQFRKSAPCRNIEFPRVASCSKRHTAKSNFWQGAHR